MEGYMGGDTLKQRLESTNTSTPGADTLKQRLEPTNTSVTLEPENAIRHLYRE